MQKNKGPVKHLSQLKLDASKVKMLWGALKGSVLCNKEDNAQVILCICDVDVNNVLSYMKEVVGGENPMQNIAEQEFWPCLQSSQLLTELLHT